MKKCIYFLLFTLVLASADLKASTRWTIQGIEYQVDTISHFYVGPGTTKTVITLSNRKRTDRMYYTTTDLSNPYVTLRAINAHDGIWGTDNEEHVYGLVESKKANPSGDEVLSKMIKHRKGAFIGVNADFFGDFNDRRSPELVYRFPMYGHVISDGETYNMRVSAAENTFNLRAGNVPAFGRVEYTATVKANGKSAKLTSVNTDRAADYLVLYTNRLNTYNHGTRANDYGSEAYLAVVSGSFKSGSTLKLKVESLIKNKGNMAVADANHVVLSGHGTGQKFIDGLSVGNTVEITPTLKINGSIVNDVMQSVGGLPMLLKNGEILNTENALNHLTEQLPRTAIGAGNGKVVLFVSDGRIGAADGDLDGLRSKEVADILKHLGCTEALNFDGGGSSEMYSKDFGILNRVSDGSEREVYNGLFVATSDPSYVDNNTIASIRFVDWAKNLKSRGAYSPVVYGYNQYGVLINKEVQKLSKFSLECPELLGTISGKTLNVGKYNGTYALTARYGTASTKIAVTVTGGVNPPDPKPDPEPDPDPNPGVDPDKEEYKVWTIQNTKFRIDTVSHFYIGPGTTRIILDLKSDEGRRQRLYFTTTDLTNPDVTIKMGMAGNGILGVDGTEANPCGDEVLSKIIKHKSEMFSGINADFFGNINDRRHPEIWYHTPFYGHAISDGEPYYIRPEAAENTFCFTADKKPVYGRAEYTARVEVNGQTANLTSVNTRRDSHYLTLYTNRLNTYHHGTRANEWGTEVKLTIDNQPLTPGKTTVLTATEKVSAEGNMFVDNADTYVLSGNGNGETFAKKISVGDKVKITPTLKVDGREVNNVMQMVGGMPMILRNGVILNTQNALPHLTEKHPRSTVGSSANGNKVVMLVADGRNMGGSSGLTSKELADVMRHVGCEDAINFDGGGSSEMYDINYGIINNPSDGKERQVINGLFVAAVNPEYMTDKTVAQIRFKDARKILKIEEKYTPEILGYNAHGVLVSTTPLTGFTLSCPSSVGYIRNENTFVGTGESYFGLTANYKGLTARIPVFVSNVATGVELNEEERHISIFTAEDAIYVAGVDVEKINVFSMSGELVAFGNEDSLDISNLSTGIYIVQVFDVNGEVHTSKICKK